MENNLKRKAVVGTMWSTIQRFGKMGISFFANLVMARLLTPEDYGAIGILMVFIALSIVFVDSGFGNSLIQKEKPTEEDYSTIFFFNLIIAGLLYLILYFSAPAIARFYKMDVLCKMLRVLGLVLVINAMSIIQDCRMRKKLNFKVLSIATIVSSVFGAGVGIYLAVKGFGVWSLVVYNLVEAFVRALMLWIQCKWKPKFVFWFSSLRELFKFGGFLLANSLLVTLRRNAMAMVLGKLYSARDLGMYSQAKKLEDVPVTSVSSIIGQITFPLYSMLQNDNQSLQNAQRRGFIYIAFASIPLMVLLMVVAEPLIVFLYTDKWIEAVPYLQLLCFSGIFFSLQEVNGSIINAKGQSKLFFIWSVVKTITLFLLIFIGSFFGIYGLMISFVLQYLLTYLINAVLASKYTGYSLWMQLKDIIPIFIVSVVAAVVSYLCGKLFYHHLLMLLVQSTIFILIYFLGFFFINKSLILDLFDILKSVFYRKNNK